MLPFQAKVPFFPIPEDVLTCSGGIDVEHFYVKWDKILQVCVKKFQPTLLIQKKLMNLSGRMDKAMCLVYDIQQAYVDTGGDKKIE